MSIVITTPTGHIGSKLTQRLLDAGSEVTLLARDPANVADAAKRGARVLKGSLDDETFVVEATRGASALFWLTPPNTQAPDFRAYQRRLGAIATRAIEVNRIPRVVNLSSVGAHLGYGVGPVNGLYDVEQAINRAHTTVTHLRPGVFMENILMSLPTITSASAIYLPASPTVKLPMVATQDIAAEAAKLLLEGGWSGRRALHLYGPREITFGDVAEILSRALGKTVKFVQVTPEQARQTLLGLGMSAELVAQYLELYDAFDKGRFFENLSATPDLRGSTIFEAFAETVVRPLVV